MRKAAKAILVFLATFTILFGYAITDGAIHRVWIYEDNQAVIGVALMSIGITAIWLYFSNRKPLG